MCLLIVVCAVNAQLTKPIGISAAQSAAADGRRRLSVARTNTGGFSSSEAAVQAYRRWRRWQGCTSGEEALAEATPVQQLDKEDLLERRLEKYTRLDIQRACTSIACTTANKAIT